MSNIPNIKNFKITDSKVTYVPGDQTNHNYTCLHHDARVCNHSAVNPDPQLPPQDATGRTTRSQSSQASPSPRSFAAHPQESWQYSIQYQANHGFQPDPSCLQSAPNLPPDFSGNHNHAQQPTAMLSYPHPPTPAQLPPTSWGPRSSMASTPQSPPPNSHLNPSNGSKAASPTHPQGQTSRRSNDRGPVPAWRKH